MHCVSSQIEGRQRVSAKRRIPPGIFDQSAICTLSEPNLRVSSPSIPVQGEVACRNGLIGIVRYDFKNGRRGKSEFSNRIRDRGKRNDSISDPVSYTHLRAHETDSYL